MLLDTERNDVAARCLLHPTWCNSTDDEARPGHVKFLYCNRTIMTCWHFIELCRSTYHHEPDGPCTWCNSTDDEARPGHVKFLYGNRTIMTCWHLTELRRSTYHHDPDIAGDDEERMPVQQCDWHWHAG